MKNQINYSKFSAILIALMIFSILKMNGQDKQPKFYTDNGTKEVTGDLDCATLKDLMVKVPIPSSAFKYDDVQFSVEVNLHIYNDGDDVGNKFYYTLDFLQKKFGIQFDGKTEMSYWLLNSKDNWGDFEGADGKIRQAVFCGSSPKDKITVTFQLMGYIKESENDYYNQKTATWEKQPVWDAGTSLGKTVVEIKQTPENIQSYKKNKRKAAIGF